MCLGILPALLILYVRSRVEDPEVFREARARAATARCRCGRSSAASCCKTTIAASVLATGIQGGYYAMFTWIPTYLKKERDLTVVGTCGYLFVVIAGAFLGYLCAGLRARPARAASGRSRCSRRWRACRWSLYFLVPAGSNTTLLLVGFPLGFFASGCFSGFGSYLAELYPTRARGDRRGLLLQRRPRHRRAVPGHHRVPRGGDRARRRGRVRRVRLRAGDRRAGAPAGDPRARVRASSEPRRRAARRPGLRPRAAALRRRAGLPGARAGRAPHAAPPPRARRGGGAHERARRCW